MILVDKDTKVIVQGATGEMGRLHSRRMLEYGTRVMGTVTPGKGGSKIHGVPVFDSMHEAVEATGATCSCIFVPRYSALDAAAEAVDAGIKLIVMPTEGIPPSHTARFVAEARAKGTQMIGPNSAGIITPGQTLVGLLPRNIFKPGRVGLVGKSGSVTYEVALALSDMGLGQSTCVAVGGDPLKGLDFRDVIPLFEQDPDTDIIVMVGEIGGLAEEEMAATIKAKQIKKPVVAYIIGRCAPPGKRMGHAGAIVAHGKGTAQSKIEALTEAGVKVGKSPNEVAQYVADALKATAHA